MELKDITESLPQKLENFQEMREIILANTVMLGEIPSPTSHEEKRVRYLCDRFTESGLQNISTDELGNGVAILPGKVGANNIVIAAPTDTPFSKNVDHAVRVDKDTITGPAIANNSLALAALAVLPTIFEKMGIQFNDNIIFIGHTRSMGYGNLEGIRFFLDNNHLNIRSAICLSGVHLGRLSFSALGMLRGTIECETPSAYDWKTYDGNGAIASLTRIIDRILAIPTPQQPLTKIILGLIEGGTGFNTIASHAKLGFEVRSEQYGMVSGIEKQIANIVELIKYETDTNIVLNKLAQRSTGSIPFQHPLVNTAKEIMGSLNIKPRIAPSTGPIAAFIAKKIPALTVGLTSGKNINEKNETMMIEPTYKGLTNLIGILKAIDEGICDVES